MNDAVDRAIQDQQLAGIDVINDGEMRQRGFVQSFAHRITGLRNVGAPRKVGEVGLDLEPVFETTGKLVVEHGFGIVEEFTYLKAHVDRPVKGPIPGPFAITSFLKPVAHYRDRPHLAEEFVPAINAEIAALSPARSHAHSGRRARCSWALRSDPHRPRDIARLFNACIAGIRGVKFALHICFGTYKLANACLIPKR